MENNTKNKIQSFTDLIAWKESHKLVVEIYKKTKSFPREELFGLTNQIRRAAVSITSNIAEGFSRRSSKEKAQFFSTALGSLTEVQNQLLVSRDVEYLSENDFNHLAQKTVTSSKLLNGLLKSVRSAVFCLILTTVYLILSAPSAHAGTIIKSPAYLGLQYGLVGCWTFDGPDLYGTTAVDCSGHGGNGTLTNGPVPTIGKIGQALDFDGVNDEVITSTTSGGGSTANATFSAWLNPDSLGNYFGIFNSRDVALQGILLSNAASNPITYSWEASPDEYSAATELYLDQNQWNFVSVVIEPTKATIYLYDSSGVVQTWTNTKTHNSKDIDNVWTIGRDQGLPSRWWNGKIDDVRLFKRSLSANEIARMYRIGLGSKQNRASGGDPLDYGLVGHWTFDGSDISGTRAKDRSGNVNHGTLTNGPIQAIGRIGQGLQLDGSDDYVNVPDMPSVSITGNFTLAAWIKLRAIGTQYSIIEKYDTGSTEGYILRVSSGNKLQTYTLDNSTSTSLTGTRTLSANVWYHVVATYDGANLRTYIDGTLDNTGADTRNPTDGEDTLKIGARGNDAGTPLNGSIDDVRIYNRALSAGEIQRLYQQSQPKINVTKNSLDYGLVGHWTFDGSDISGTRAKDRSGNNAHGTIANGPIAKAGRIGQALSFDGVNDYVGISSSAVANYPYSASIWFKTNADATSGALAAISQGANTASTYYFEIALDTGSTCAQANYLLYLAKANTNPAISVCSTKAVNDNVWHHAVAVTSAINSHKLYLDGVLIGTDTSALTSGMAMTRTGIGILYRSSIANYFNGSLDDARVYNRALSAGEVNKLWQMGR